MFAGVLIAFKIIARKATFISYSHQRFICRNNFPTNLASSDTNSASQVDKARCLFISTPGDCVSKHNISYYKSTCHQNKLSVINLVFLRNSFSKTNFVKIKLI